MKPNESGLNGEKHPVHIRLLASFLRTFFKLLYHQFAWTYDWVATIVSLGKWQNWILSVLPYVEGPNVLEIGHGPGHLLLALSAAGINAVGLDESSQMSRQAYHRILCKGLQPLLINGLAQHLPFPDSCFSQVLSTFPSEYIYIPQTLAEIHRVLVPGGELLVLPAAWITGRKWYDRLAANLFRVTRQSPDAFTPSLVDEFSTPFQNSGFIVRAEILELENSRLLLFHALNPKTQFSDNPSP